MRSLIIAIAIMLTFHKSKAQYTFFSPDDAYALEISLPDSPYLRMPMYRNAVTALGNYDDFVIGGTTAERGLSPFIFISSLRQKKLLKLIDLRDHVPGQRSISAGWIAGKDNVFFGGTLGYDGAGHLLMLSVNHQGDIRVSDLGSPVEGQGIFSLCISPDKEALYGISYPGGDLFSYHISSGKTRIHPGLMPAGKETAMLEHSYGMKPEDYLPKALTTDAEGNVYGSAPVNRLFIFNPRQEKFTFLEEQLPEVWGRRVLSQVEAWVWNSKGKLFGSNRADGQLFEWDYKNAVIKNLGKPVMMPGMNALAIGKDDTIYGIAGGAPGYAHLFSYDEKKGFRDYGNPEFNMKEEGMENPVKWRGFQIASLITSRDGQYVIMGENEALSQLMIFKIPAR